MIVVVQQEVEVIKFLFVLLDIAFLLNLDQSAISTSTRRILSARSINYRRAPRIKPIDLHLDEECDELSGKSLYPYTNDDAPISVSYVLLSLYLVYPTTRLHTGRLSTTSSQLWAPPAWSFSYLHRAIIAIDEQAQKDYDAGRPMIALAAWQNALIFCDELSQRTQLWPENVYTYTSICTLLIKSKETPNLFPLYINKLHEIFLFLSTNIYIQWLIIRYPCGY